MEAPVARISNSGTAAWYLTDNLGSVRVLTNNAGAVIDEINYDAYGNILTQTEPSVSDRYLWTGQQFDSVTGLQFNRARYYDPTIGRWTSEDPLGSRRRIQSLSLCARSADALHRPVRIRVVAERDCLDRAVPRSERDQAPLPGRKCHHVAEWQRDLR